MVIVLDLGLNVAFLTTVLANDLGGGAGRLLLGRDGSGEARIRAGAPRSIIVDTRNLRNDENRLIGYRELITIVTKFSR